MMSDSGTWGCSQLTRCSTGFGQTPRYTDLIRRMIHDGRWTVTALAQRPGGLDSECDLSAAARQGANRLN
jgi:hypothetical protein